LSNKTINTQEKKKFLSKIVPILITISTIGSFVIALLMIDFGPPTTVLQSIINGFSKITTEVITKMGVPVGEFKSAGILLSDLFLDIYETNTASGAADSVRFRDWDSSLDLDLQANNHSERAGASYYVEYSNTFNQLGGGGSDTKRISSDIHFPFDINSSIDIDGMSFAGIIVAEQRSQGSSAFAEISILVDGHEKWRTDSPITGNTVRPAEFLIDISELSSEIIIRTSCAPLGSGLSLGFIGIGIVEDVVIVDDELPISQAASVDELEGFFVNSFFNITPDDAAVRPVTYRNWDTFIDADLRGEHYTNSSYNLLFLKMSDTFNILGGSRSSPTVVDAHLIINPRRNADGLEWTGSIVAEQSTKGSPAYADVIILIDGIEKWRTSEPITGTTVAPVRFNVDLSDAEYEVVIRVICTPLGDGLALGFVDTN